MTASQMSYTSLNSVLSSLMNAAEKLDGIEVWDNSIGHSSYRNSETSGSPINSSRSLNERTEGPLSIWLEVWADAPTIGTAALFPLSHLVRRSDTITLQRKHEIATLRHPIIYQRDGLHAQQKHRYGQAGKTFDPILELQLGDIFINTSTLLLASQPQCG